MRALNFDKHVMLSKHFRNTWARKWDWGMPELRAALKEAYKIDKVGKTKYEVYVKYKKKSRKIILVNYGNEIFVKTGAEGK